MSLLRFVGLLSAVTIGLILVPTAFVFEAFLEPAWDRLTGKAPPTPPLVRGKPRCWTD